MRFSGICTCPLNSQLVDEVCVCNEGSEMKDNQCVVIPVPTCPANAKWNGVNCECSQGYDLKDGSCVEATPNNANNCPAKSAWDGSACVCITGLFMINGECQKCQDNSTYDTKSQRCICNPGFYGDFTACFECDSSCKTCWGGAKDRCITCRNKYKLTNGECICKPNKKCN